MNPCFPPILKMIECNLSLIDHNVLLNCLKLIDLIDWNMLDLMPNWNIEGFVVNLWSCPWKSKYEIFMYDYDEKYMHVSSIKVSW